MSNLHQGQAAVLAAGRAGAADAAADASGAEAPAASDADAAQVIERVRRLMRVTVALTFILVAAVFGIIGYRLYRSGGSPEVPADATVILPEGARVIQTAVAGDRIVVTIARGGATEIRSYDLHTLRPVGRIQFTTAP